MNEVVKTYLRLHILHGGVDTVKIDKNKLVVSFLSIPNTVEVPLPNDCNIEQMAELTLAKLVKDIEFEAKFEKVLKDLTQRKINNV
jgi:hypothetical protein